MRLRDLASGVGSLPVGAENFITDVQGVSVGHAACAAADLFCGVSAVVPYPPEVGERRLFVGAFSLDGGGRLSGRGVAEDFGTFSTPLVLAPAAAAGRVYDGVIAYGLGRDPGLSTVSGWPPVVLGLDDGFFNPAPAVWRGVGREELRQALKNAAQGGVAEGNVGVGRGLAAFGYKGGIGGASRLAGAHTDGSYTDGSYTDGSYTDGSYAVGALVAAGGGDTEFLAGGDWAAVGAGAEYGGDAAAVVATDAPLLPHQLDRLAARAFVGLVRSGLVGPQSARCNVLAFSTAAPARPEEDSPTEAVGGVGEAACGPLHRAAAEACEEAVYNALLAAQAVRFNGKELPALPVEALRGRRGE